MTRLGLVAAAIAGTVACGGSSGAVGTADAVFTPVATVGQVMAAMVIPASQALFDSVVYVNGELTQSPKTDDDWFQLQLKAIAVAEAGNLLLMAPRAKDASDWVALSKAMTTAAARVEQAADAKSIDLMLQTGGELYDACTNCHQKYLMAD
jgi:cytochrome c556